MAEDVNFKGQEFVEAARKFCAWAESSPGPADLEVTEALRHLVPLYQGALNLPDVFGDEDANPISNEQWQGVVRRFGALPFNYYSQCFDPHQVPSEEPVVADVADDLADIWRDVKQGLELFQNGHKAAALWRWRESFVSHWGHHAVGAMYALHCWQAADSDESAT